MAPKMKQSRSTFDLLELPDAAINTTLTCLATADKENFMAACRKAFCMTMLTAEITLKVTNDATFAGIKQVLDSFPRQLHLQIVFPPLQEGRVTLSYYTLLSALPVFMGMVPDSYLTKVASSCLWESITRVTIQGTQLRCLVPQFLALTCPNLTQLKIMKPDSNPPTEKTFSHETANAVPLTVCSSLKWLEINHGKDETEFELPPTHHCREELCHSLPNIDTLILRGLNTALIGAFATQLKRLEIAQDPTACEQSIRQCFNVQHLRLQQVILPDKADCLKSLELANYLTDEDMGKLLKLPNLCKLKVEGFDQAMEKDWSGHACSWQELHINNLPLMIELLSKLNLKSLKKMSMCGDQWIELPDPSDPNSLAAIQRIVDSLAGVGQIAWRHQDSHAETSFGYCGTVEWRDYKDSGHHEHAVAEMVTLLAKRIPPGRVCLLETFLYRPLFVRAVLDWGHSCIESVILGTYNAKPGIWEALQQLPRLTTLAFYHEFDTASPEAEDDQLARDMLTIASAVHDAVQHYVIPANRRLRMECGLNRTYQRWRSLAKQGRRFLKSAIQHVLPAGCKLDSIALQYAGDDKAWTSYGGATDAELYWVILLEPQHSAA